MNLQLRDEFFLLIYPYMYPKLSCMIRTISIVWDEQNTAFPPKQSTHTPTSFTFVSVAFKQRSTKEKQTATVLLDLMKLFLWLHYYYI